jgi:hypothetical protein
LQLADGPRRLDGDRRVGIVENWKKGIEGRDVLDAAEGDGRRLAHSRIGMGELTLQLTGTETASRFEIGDPAPGGLRGILPRTGPGIALAPAPAAD